jgi:hypothetical protein
MVHRRCPLALVFPFLPTAHRRRRCGAVQTSHDARAAALEFAAAAASVQDSRCCIQHACSCLCAAAAFSLIIAAAAVFLDTLRCCA